MLCILIVYNVYIIIYIIAKQIYIKFVNQSRLCMKYEYANFMKKAWEIWKIFNGQPQWNSMILIFS